jgi:hypothetical protein
MCDIGPEQGILYHQYHNVKRTFEGYKERGNMTASCQKAKLINFRTQHNEFM